MKDNDNMSLEKAMFILRHGSAEGMHKYFEAIGIIEKEITRQKEEIEKLKEAIITADECFSEGLFAKGFDTIINILSEVRNETN